MSAARLRAAAALMRERARRVSPPPHEPWVVLAAEGEWTHVVDSMGAEVATSTATPYAEHFASWHPAVALAVADWLDEQANEYEANKRIWDRSSLAPENRWAERGLTVDANLKHHHGHALAVADAYLGGVA